MDSPKEGTHTTPLRMVFEFMHQPSPPPPAPGRPSIKGVPQNQPRGWLKMQVHGPHRGVSPSVGLERVQGPAFLTSASDDLGADAQRNPP